MNRLRDKVAVVTGGASGIGLATAQLFAEEGAHAISFDIHAEGIDSLHVDVTSASAVESAIKNVVDKHGHIDILVNVAGGSGRRWGDGPADSCTLEGWEKTLALNLDSVFYCCKYPLQTMLAQGSGVIVNVSSVLGMVSGNEDFATHAYASSKGAVISLTRSIASCYATRGIREMLFARV